MLTSPNAVEALLLRAHDARALAGPKIAVIGPGTADALLAHGILADIVPERAVGESLAQALARLGLGRALIARAERGPRRRARRAAGAGTEVDVLALYRTVAEPMPEAARARRWGPSG